MALDGVSWVWGGLVADAVGRLDRPHATKSAPSPTPSLGQCSARDLVSVSCLLPLNLSGSELCAVPEHGMHDDGEPARQRDPRLAHGRAPADGERPVLEGELATIAGEHDVGRLVQQGANPSVAAL